MKTTIYYHSGTGNSLALARRIARELGDAECVPVAAMRKAPTRPAAERVGLVFPVIGWGPPRSVREFLAGFDPSGVRYFFAVASCGGTPARSIPMIGRLLRKNGGRLHAGYTVRSKSYFGVSDGGSTAKLIAMVRNLSGKLPGLDDERMPEIIEEVRALRPHRAERSALVGALVGGFMNGMFSSQMARMDGLYRVTEACDGCGICARVCPRENVALKDGRPEWRHDCESCGACATWCPRNAIAMGAGEPAPSGHNPQVVLKDLVLRA